MSNERAEELIRKYLEGIATPEEEALLESWYIEIGQKQPDVASVPDYEKIKNEMLGALRAEQEGQLRPVIKSPVRLWPRIAAAACILIVISIGGFLIFRKKPTQRVDEGQPLATDILPAGTRATLTLLDGRTIPLDSMGRDNLAMQGGAVVSSKNGQLMYSAGGGAGYNTLTTRPGEHYSVVLPDGTKVWLNAGASITYPVAFTGNERRVRMTGELYFEIVHDPRQPFTIEAPNQVVEDIGTHLNINAYDDEPVVSTTLLEGSVKVMKDKKLVILLEGQQALLGKGDSSFRVRQIDAEQAVAWKNGYFYFDRADIKTVMREISRWYNVEVIYKGEVTKRTFKGKVYRNINIAEALNILSYFGAHFKIEGRVITVSI
ncbi:MAG: FecR domain-containing protein [Bacteroidetes bacterium]|nr:FecR domain-containing protein [Bacteroidota bacterium]